MFFGGGAIIGWAMSLISRISGCLLALLLVLTSTQAAVARAGMSMNGMLVLCLGAQMVLLPMGPDGQPQEMPHLCPDCTLGAMADLAQPGLQPAPLCTRQIRYAQPAISGFPGPEVTPSARAPPLSSV